MYIYIAGRVFFSSCDSHSQVTAPNTLLGGVHKQLQVITANIFCVCRWGSEKLECEAMMMTFLSYNMLHFMFTLVYQQSYTFISFSSILAFCCEHILSGKSVLKPLCRAVELVNHVCTSTHNVMQTLIHSFIHVHPRVCSLLENLHRLCYIRHSATWEIFIWFLLI